MAGFLIGFFMDRGINDEQRAAIIASFDDIVARRKKGEIELDEAHKIARMLGAREDSTRLALRQFIHLLLEDADTEATLECMGIDVDDISPDTVPMQPWEVEIREGYVLDAKESIVSALQEIYGITDKDERDKILEQEFPAGNWWGAMARELVQL